MNTPAHQVVRIDQSGSDLAVSFDDGTTRTWWAGHPATTRSYPHPLRVGYAVDDGGQMWRHGYSGADRSLGWLGAANVVSAATTNSMVGAIDTDNNLWVTLLGGRNIDAARQSKVTVPGGAAHIFSRTPTRHGVWVTNPDGQLFRVDAQPGQLVRGNGWDGLVSVLTRIDIDAAVCGLFAGGTSGFTEEVLAVGGDGHMWSISPGRQHPAAPAQRATQITGVHDAVDVTVISPLTWTLTGGGDLRCGDVNVNPSGVTVRRLIDGNARMLWWDDIDGNVWVTRHGDWPDDHDTTQIPDPGSELFDLWWALVRSSPRTIRLDALVEVARRII